MQFIITAWDGTDPDAPARRQAVRAVHMAGAEQMYKDKTLLYAVAILNEAGGMVGSTMIVDFPSRQALQADWLDSEPYVTGDVWRKIDIRPCAAPGFCLEK